MLKKNDVTLNCANGIQLVATDGIIEIYTKRTTEAIPVASIQSVSVKDPGRLSSGSITFRTAQAAKANINLGFGISAALGAEKTFLFSKDEQYTAYTLRDYILNYEKNKKEAEAKAEAARKAQIERNTAEMRRRLEAQQRIEEQAKEQPSDDIPTRKIVSIVDELRGLKSLINEGILTEEEFAAKKKQLLGI